MFFHWFYNAFVVFSFCNSHAVYQEKHVLRNLCLTNSFPMILQLQLSQLGSTALPKPGVVKPWLNHWVSHDSTMCFLLIVASSASEKNAVGIPSKPNGISMVPRVCIFHIANQCVGEVRRRKNQVILRVFQWFCNSVFWVSDAGL